MSNSNETTVLRTLKGNPIPSSFSISPHVLSLRHDSSSEVSTRAVEVPRKTFSQGKIVRGLAAFVLLCGLSLSTAGIFVGDTVSYFKDFETSLANVFKAGLLDFLVADDTYARTITGTSTPVVIPVMTPEFDSLEIMYRVFAEQTGGSDALCSSLNLVATSSPFIFSGPLLGATTTATTTVGTWQIGLELAATTGIANGDICNVDLVYRGWHPTAPEYTGFTDEERVHLIITYEAPPPSGSPFDIVLNEFLPNPDDEANGMNLGDDASNQPLGEWIELYNKGDAPVDVAGWFMTDASGGVGNTHAVIDNTNTNTGSTIIAAHGWLVVYLNKPSLNNTGDEIYLYTPGGVQVDFYSYNDPSDFCELEPSPGDTNATSTGSGTPGQGPNADCIENQVAPNKTYARIPDGIGAWVDPIPTPGGPNIPDPEPIVEIEEATTTPETQSSGGGGSSDHEEITETASTTPEMSEGDSSDETATTTPEVIEEENNSGGGTTEPEEEIPVEETTTENSETEMEAPTGTGSPGPSLGNPIPDEDQDVGETEKMTVPEEEEVVELEEETAEEEAATEGEGEGSEQESASEGEAV